MVTGETCEYRAVARKSGPAIGVVVLMPKNPDCFPHDEGHGLPTRPLEAAEPNPKDLDLCIDTARLFPLWAPVPRDGATTKAERAVAAAMHDDGLGAAIATSTTAAATGFPQMPRIWRRKTEETVQSNLSRRRKALLKNLFFREFCGCYVYPMSVCVFFF
jgi:hypothetical protein